MDEQPKPTDSRSQEPSQDACVVIASETLFREQREVIIEHEGERYRLRITRRGKLILQK